MHSSSSSNNALVDSAALLLFQRLRDDMANGKLADITSAQGEVEAAIAQLNRILLPHDPTQMNEGRLLLELFTVRDALQKCESQLVAFQYRADTLREDTAILLSRTEDCHERIQQQQKENVQILAAIQSKADLHPTSSPCAPPAPAPSPTNALIRPGPSRPAVISFPGGPRTVTIHPPTSPNYQSIIHDDKGDVIIDFRQPKPLRREGAFRTPCDEDRPARSRTVIAAPRWLNLSHPPPAPPRPRCPRQITARQESPPPEGTPDLPNLAVSASPSPPSPTVGKGKKRMRPRDEDDGLSGSGPDEQLSVVVERRIIRAPATPGPAECEEPHAPERPSKRRKLRASAAQEGSSTRSLARTRTMLDATRTA